VNLPDHVDTAGKINFLAQALWRARRARERRNIGGIPSDLPVEAEQVFDQRLTPKKILRW